MRTPLAALALLAAGPLLQAVPASPSTTTPCCPLAVDLHAAAKAKSDKPAPPAPQPAAPREPRRAPHPSLPAHLFM